MEIEAATVRTYNTEYAAHLLGRVGAIENWDAYKDLDLDGDGGAELVVQMVEQPQQFNAVFHYGDGELSCWQYDIVEMSCRDYPLEDGAMVRQYDTGTGPIGIPTSTRCSAICPMGRRRSAPPWRYTRIRRRMARRYSPIWWTTRRWIRTPLRRSLRNWWGAGFCLWRTGFRLRSGPAEKRTRPIGH